MNTYEKTKQKRVFKQLKTSFQADEVIGKIRNMIAEFKANPRTKSWQRAILANANQGELNGIYE